MTLHILTAGGALTLGDAPAGTHAPCAFCGAPAQVAASTPEKIVAACAGCTENALLVAATLADTPGGVVEW